MIPISNSCKASNTEQVDSLITSAVNDFMKRERPPVFTKFKVVSSLINNNSIKKKDILNRIVVEIGKDCVVDLKSPSLVVFVYVLQSMFLIGVCDKYSESLEFNLNSTKPKDTRAPTGTNPQQIPRKEMQQKSEQEQSQHKESEHENLEEAEEVPPEERPNNDEEEEDEEEEDIKIF